MTNEVSSVSAWLARFKGGDRVLPVEKLWERYFHQLVSLARAKLGDHPRRAADEEDVAISAFHSFCQGVANGRFPDLDSRDNLWSLLVTIAARKVYRLKLTYNRQKRGGNVFLDVAAIECRDGDAETLGLAQFIAQEPTPEFAAQAIEEYQRLLAQLPDDNLRELANWKMEGFTNEEIAIKLSCVERTVERRLMLIRSLWTKESELG